MFDSGSPEGSADLKTAICSSILEIISDYRKRANQGVTDTEVDLQTWADRIIDVTRRFPAEIAPEDPEAVLTPLRQKSGGGKATYEELLENKVFEESAEGQALRKEIEKLKKAERKKDYLLAGNDKNILSLEEEVESLAEEARVMRETLGKKARDALSGDGEAIQLREKLAQEKKRADDSEKKHKAVLDTIEQQKREFMDGMWEKSMDLRELEAYRKHFEDPVWKTLVSGISNIASRSKEKVQEEEELVMDMMNRHRNTYSLVPETPETPTEAPVACDCQATTAELKRTVDHQQAKTELLEQQLAKAVAEAMENPDEARQEQSAQLQTALDKLEAEIASRHESDEARDAALEEVRLLKKKVQLLQRALRKATEGSRASSPFSAKTPGTTTSDPPREGGNRTLGDELGDLGEATEMGELWDRRSSDGSLQMMFNRGGQDVVQEMLNTQAVEIAQLKEEVARLEGQVQALSEKSDDDGVETPTISPQAEVIRKLKDQVSLLEEEVKRLNSLDSSKEDELESRGKTIAAKEDEIRQLNEKLKRLDSVDDAFAQAKEELASPKKELKTNEEIDRLNSAIRTKNDETKLLENKITSVEDEMRLRNEEIDRLSSVADVKDAELKSLGNKVASGEEEILKLKEDVENLIPADEEYERQRQELAALEAGFESNEELYREVQELQKEVEDLKSVLAGKEEELAHLREELASAEKEILELNAKVSGLQKDIDNLHSAVASPGPSESEELESLRKKLASKDEVIRRIGAVSADIQDQELSRKLDSKVEEVQQLKAEITRLEGDNEGLVSAASEHAMRKKELEALQRRHDEAVKQAGAAGGKAPEADEAAERIRQLEKLISDELDFHEELQKQVGSVDSLTSSAHEMETEHLRRSDEIWGLKNKLGLLEWRMDEAKEGGLMGEWKDIDLQKEELEKGIGLYKADLGAKWSELDEARRKMQRLIDEARRKLQGLMVDRSGTKKRQNVGPQLGQIPTILDHGLARLPYGLGRHRLVQTLLQTILAFMGPHIDFCRRFSSFGFVSFLHASHLSFPPFPRLLPEDSLYVLCYAMALTTFQTYVSATRERHLWLHANSRLTRAYLYDLQYENPYHKWLWNADPRLMIGGYEIGIVVDGAWDLLLEAMVPSGGWTFGLFDTIVWGVLRKVVGMGPLDRWA